MTRLDDATRDLLDEALRRYHFDAEHHAVAYLVAELTSRDLYHRLPYEMTEHERRIARLAASIALVVNERKTEWLGLNDDRT